MRISSRCDDLGFREDRRGIECLLDGKRVRDVVTADEERGEIVVRLRDDGGNLVSDGDRVAQETRRGVVRIVMP